MRKAIGIDLGTTNSVMAVFEGNEAEVIPNSRGARITPSVVAFSKEGEILVGQSAKNQAVINSERTIESIKREMGSHYNKSIDGKKYTPEEISSSILRKLKKDGEEYLGCEVKEAVITVPAYFNEAQRQATINAGRIAGLEVMRIINEPTAAALAYGVDDSEEQVIMVFDIGGGTYDVSILEIGNGIFQVLATSGNNHLGGDDFDQCLIDYVAQEFNKKEKIDLRKDRMALQRLKEEVEKVKVELSESTVAQLNIPFITANQEGPKHLEMKISRSLFESLIEDLVDSIGGPAEAAIKDAKLTKDQIDTVLLVGGSTRIPCVKEKITSIIDRVSRKNVNPDECVALGAAIQTGIIKGDAKGIVLVDVIPLTLGIEVEGGNFVPIIERNTPIPVSKTKLFTTISDHQKMVEVKVYQGERKIVAANKFLGNFQLKNIREAAKNEPRIEVSFDIDVDGILHVSARDLDTNSKQEVDIKGSTSLTEDEIQRMLEQAEQYQEQDREYTIKMNLLNQAEGLIIEGYDLINYMKENELTTDYEDRFLDLKDAVEELESLKSKEELDLDEFKEMVETVTTLLAQFENIKIEMKDLNKNDSKETKGESDDIAQDDLEILE